MLPTKLPTKDVIAQRKVPRMVSREGSKQAPSEGSDIAMDARSTGEQLHEAFRKSLEGGAKASSSTDPPARQGLRPASGHSTAAARDAAREPAPSASAAAAAAGGAPSASSTAAAPESYDAPEVPARKLRASDLASRQPSSAALQPLNEHDYDGLLSVRLALMRGGAAAADEAAEGAAAAATVTSLQLRRSVFFGASASRRRVSPPLSKALPQELLLGDLGPEEVCRVAEGWLFESLPPDCVVDLEVEPLRNDASKARFLRTLQDDGAQWSQVQVAWYVAGSQEGADGIIAEGIRCDHEHGSCGPCGHGGNVALTPAEAGGAGSAGVRRLFLVLALPERDVVQGQRGVRPPRTAVDNPKGPAQYCFADASRLHCACLLKFRWAPTEPPAC